MAAQHREFEFHSERAKAELDLARVPKVPQRPPRISVCPSSTSRSFEASEGTLRR